METYFAMNKEIVRLLRISDEVDKQYAALRIEELERYSEECQKVKNVLLETLEEVLEQTKNIPACPFCQCYGAGFHRAGCTIERIKAAIRKARQESEG